jgi:HD-GYP domain-containing protein (c-di-GMP phosphodiesterase class II)
MSSLQEVYENERLQRMQRALSIACVLGFILLPTFGFIDYIVAPHKFGFLISIRFICSLSLAVLFLLNRTPFGAKHSSYLAIYGAASIAGSIALMTYALGGPKSPYYAAISLVVIVAGLILPMTVWEGVVTCVIIYVTYVLLSLSFLQGENLVYFTGNSFHILATMAVVLIGFRLKEQLTLQEIERRLQLSEASRKLEDYAKNLEEKVREQTFNIMQALAYAIEAKDVYTRGHSERVKNYSVALAERLGLSEHETMVIGHAAVLHDIGKVKVSGHIIQKPNPLTEDEYSDMREHPAFGETIIQGISFLQKTKPLIRHHHERWDGKGYPDGLKGEEIPLGARIIAVADVYDALTFQRPYREGATTEQAFLQLREGRGRFLDPELVETFIDIIQERGEAAAFRAE